jgi:hypothetical protein
MIVIIKSKVFFWDLLLEQDSDVYTSALFYYEEQISERVNNFYSMFIKTVIHKAEFHLKLAEAPIFIIKN